MSHRLQQAAHAFAAQQEYLTCQEVPLAERFHTCALCVRPIALFGSGTWMWTHRAAQEITSWEQCQLRRITRVRPRPQEGYAGWLRRHTAFVREYFFGRLG